MFNPAAIERYLQWTPGRPAPVKKMSEKELYDLVYHKTGVPLEFKTPPRGLYQIAATAFAIVEGRSALFLDMRTGKSFCALNWAAHLKKCGCWEQQGIVVVPSHLILNVWEQEAKKHSNLSVAVVRLTFQDFLDAIDTDADLIIVPWSALQSAFTKRLPKPTPDKPKKTELVPDYEAVDELAKFFDLVIFDEIHTCKNSGSLRFKIANHLVMRCDNRLGLTGTPFGRKPFDLWAQAFLLDEGRAFGYNEHFFKAAFGKRKYNPFTRNKQAYEGIDPKKKRLFEQRLSSFSVAYSIHECFTVEVVTGTIEINMLPEQEEIYNGVIKSIIELAKMGEATEVEHGFIRLRQISSGFLPVGDDDEEKTIYRFPSAKFDYLDEFLEQAPSGAKLIIFHEFTETGRRLCETLTKHKRGYAWLYGGTKDKVAEVEKFTKGNASVLVLNSASGAMGINLSCADYQMFFECPTSPITRKQAEFRAICPGKMGLIRDDIVCSPVERKVLSFIAEGKDLLKSLVHGGISWESLSTKKKG